VVRSSAAWDAAWAAARDAAWAAARDAAWDAAGDAAWDAAGDAAGDAAWDAAWAAAGDAARDAAWAAAGDAAGDAARAAARDAARDAAGDAAGDAARDAADPGYPAGVSEADMGEPIEAADVTDIDEVPWEYQRKWMLQNIDRLGEIFDSSMTAQKDRSVNEGLRREMMKDFQEHRENYDYP
jgi:hypothetical protein